jgi:quaternary ammonium compound-resistance protein SugE
MNWLYLLLAGIFEIGFAISLKLMDGHKNIFWSVVFYVSIVGSFICLQQAIRTIPITIAYAIWTGIGTAGVAIIGVLLLGEVLTPMKTIFLSMLIISLIGLRMTAV